MPAGKIKPATGFGFTVNVLIKKALWQPVLVATFRVAVLFPQRAKLCFRSALFTTVSFAPSP